MDVLIDTNAVQAIGLDGGAFKALRSYLTRTRSRLLIPSVVLEELCANRQRALQKLERDFAAAHNDLRRLLPGSAVAPPALDISAAVTAYRSQILTSAVEVEVVPNHPDDLSELVRRLASRLPPASSNGEEARDVLIWLALLPIARSGRVALITGDRKAFLREERLRPELLADLGGSDANVAVFVSVDHFLRTHHARSSFIDIEWVKERIDTDEVKRAVQTFVDDDHYLFEREIEERGNPTGYVSFIQVVQHKVEDFFVSDVAPDELYVSVTVWAELEVEVEYENSRHDSHFRDEPRAVTTDCIYPCVRIEIQLEVRGQDVARVVIGSMEPG
jgi:PIN domain